MIVSMNPEASESEIAEVARRVSSTGATVEIVHSNGGVLIATPDWSSKGSAVLANNPLIDKILAASGAIVGIAWTNSTARSVVDVGSAQFGGERFSVIAGPCAVESRDQVRAVAGELAQSGAVMLRGDSFKPRTSPYTFQGLGEDGLKIMAEVREETGLPFVAEVLDPRDVTLVASYADALRIGTRNMANYALLHEVGKQTKPVQLKRGRSATIAEWLQAAEHIYTAGNPNVILVERGIKTFETMVRTTLDISSIPIVKKLTHLPVIVDPSHAAGRNDLVVPLALAAVAAGADGLMIDVHPAPEEALVDGEQALLPNEFDALMGKIRAVANAVGRSA